MAKGGKTFQREAYDILIIQAPEEVDQEVNLPEKRHPRRLVVTLVLR